MALSIPSLASNLQVQALVDWNDISKVRYLTRSSCKFLEDIVALNIDIPNASQSIDVLEYRESFLDDDRIVADVTLVTSGATTVTVDLAPYNGNPVEYIRVNTLMFGNNKAFQGKVVQATPGQIVLEPHAGTTVAQLAGSIVVGQQVNGRGIFVQYANSSGVTGIKRVPDWQVNYLTTMREGNDHNRVDFRKERVKSDGGYWEGAQIGFTLERFLKDIEYDMIYGLPSFDQAGEFSTNGGVDWSIRNRGGVVFGFSTLPTRAMFQDWLDTVANQRSYSQKMRKLYIGRALYAHISDNFGAGYIHNYELMAPTTGEINQNPRYIKIGGHDVELVYAPGLFQDPTFDTAPTAILGASGMKKEWQAYFIDQEPVPTVGSGVVPSIQRLHYGEGPFFAAMGKGIGDFPVGMPLTADAIADNLGQPMDMMDRSTIQFMYHGGVNMTTGKYSGWFGATI
jgi:hypothetical protein